MDEIEAEEIARKECFMIVIVTIFLMTYAGALFFWINHVREIRMGVEGFIIVLNTIALFWLRSKLMRLVQ